MPSSMTDLSDPRQTLWLNPLGHLHLAPWDEAPALAPELLGSLIPAFARGSGHGLLHLGAATSGPLGPALGRPGRPAGT